MKIAYTKDVITAFKPKHDFFIGIDSDGCVFDSMDLKQKKCFHGKIISHWNLYPIEKAVRETAEFVNLHSKWRGSNRFFALLKTFEFLKRHPATIETKTLIPSLPELEKLVNSGLSVSNDLIAESASGSKNPELESVLDWSKSVNQLIESVTDLAKPFNMAKESLDLIRKHSDSMCISQTPIEALAREWKKHGISEFVDLIAGQETGTKIQQLSAAINGKYKKERVLMIGDAIGDLEAAKKTGVLFYPIFPNSEEESWRSFYEKDFAVIIEGRYAGQMENELIEKFIAMLPEAPSWMR